MVLFQIYSKGLLFFNQVFVNQLAEDFFKLDLKNCVSNVKHHFEDQNNNVLELDFIIILLNDCNDSGSKLMIYNMKCVHVSRTKLVLIPCLSLKCITQNLTSLNDC